MTDFDMEEFIAFFNEHYSGAMDRLASGPVIDDPESCPNCGQPNFKVLGSRGTYKIGPYLRDIRLDGVALWECTACGHTWPIAPEPD